MCLTNDPANRAPLPKPEGYDPKRYELLLRVLDTGWRDFFDKFDPTPNHKTDTNNHGPFSFDNIGMNWDYPEASYEKRREIIRGHETYQKGMRYLVANDPRVPEDVRTKMQDWGLPKDEYTYNGNWSHQLYVREARRMVGQFVMTENELLKKKPTPDSVGMGSYTIDSHNVRRYVTEDGHVENLLVPVCPSASHIAFGSIRMEPVFMILGQSVATAVSLAIDAGIPVQEVLYERLRARLLQDGQILEGSKPSAAGGAEK
jgi:hypothetical protein